MDEAKDGRRRGNCPEKRRRRPDIIGMGARDIRRKHVVQFKNAKIIRRGKISEPDEDYVWMHGGKIIDPERRFWEAARDKEYAAQVIVDCSGLLMAPGYIDVQLNGAFGVDFTSFTDHSREDHEADRQEGGASRNSDYQQQHQEGEGEEEEEEEKDHGKRSPKRRRMRDDGNDIMRKVAKGILQHGVTSFCPTVITSGQPQYKKLAKLLKRRPGSRDHAHILGAHLEGPFISQYKYGAHPAHLVREPDKGFSSVVEMYGKQLIDSTAMVTIAPELKGAQEAIQGLSQRGVIVSCGHSMADLPEAEKGLECGARMITHLFNAMQPFHHRDPGLVGLLGRREKKPYYGIIADGIHAHANSVRIAFKAHPEGAVLVTDAMGAMGLGDGLYKLGDVQVRIKDDRATVVGTDTLAGSIATMDSCVRNFRKFTGCSIVEAIRAATLRPAEVLNMEKRKGSLSFGCDADIILLDTELRVVATIVSGEVAWIKDESILKCRWTY